MNVPVQVAMKHAMKKSARHALFFLTLMTVVGAFAQDPSVSEKPTAENVAEGAAPRVEPMTGPAIPSYGMAYPISEGALNLEVGQDYKVLFDVARDHESPLRANPSIESAARFMNMHAQNGIDTGNLKVTVVVHGGATRDLLSNASYQERFGGPNPNIGLLEALEDANVQVLVCGQSAAHKGYAPGEFHPSVEMALSAMTAHVRLQTEGYVIIPF